MEPGAMAGPPAEVRSREQDQRVRHARQAVHTIEHEVPARAVERTGIGEAIEIRATAPIDRELRVRVPKRVEWRVGDGIRLPDFAIHDLIVLVRAGLEVEEVRVERHGNLFATFLVASNHVAHPLATAERVVRSRCYQLVARSRGKRHDLDVERTSRATHTIVHDPGRDGVDDDRVRRCECEWGARWRGRRRRSATGSGGERGDGGRSAGNSTDNRG
jgi:hypothetical protein